MKEYKGIKGGSFTINGDIIHGKMGPLSSYTCTFEDLADVQFKANNKGYFRVSLLTHAPGDVPHEVIFDNEELAREAYDLFVERGVNIGKHVEHMEDVEAGHVLAPVAVQAPAQKRRGCLGTLGSLIVIIILITIFWGGNGDDGNAAADAGYVQEPEASTGIVEEAPDEVGSAYEWALTELENWPHLSSPWSIRARMINQGGFSEELADEVLEMLENINWAERAIVGAEELATSGQIGRNGLIEELENSLHSADTITAVMQKIDGLGIDWYEMAVMFINFHGPTSGFMNHENMFRDWMINDIGFTESEAQYAFDTFRQALDTE